MTPKATTNPEGLDDGGSDPMNRSVGGARCEARVGVPAQLWAARLARLDLDAESVEMIMAALTAEVCDEINEGPS